MGYCKILSGGTDGRYNIELDFGEAQKDAIMAALNTAINKNDLDILQTEDEIAQAQAQEQALGRELLRLQDALAAGTARQKAEATIEYPKRVAELAQLKVQNEPLRGTLRQLKFVRASLRKQAQQFNLFQPVERRQAWCTDLTEDRAAGSYVGTLEVKGEPDLVLIQPGARAWLPTDGRVTGRDIMSPWQAYWNAAVLPGWQKWKPTYRWGTISSINYSNDTCSVSLAVATSSAQRLGVNQESSLSNVPISYMTCNAQAFEEGDRVIVRFSGQDWAAPLVIGFLDNPKGCIQYDLYYRQRDNGVEPGLLLSYQRIYKNQDADEVTALEGFFEDDWSSDGLLIGRCRVWCGWNDGIAATTRHDLNIQADNTYLAQYIVRSGAGILGSTSFGSRSLDGGVTFEYIREFGLVYPEWLTVTSGPAPGNYSSGWTTWDAARLFMAGTGVTGTESRYGKTAEFGFSLQPNDDGSDGGITDQRMRLVMTSAPTSVA